MNELIEMELNMEFDEVESIEKTEDGRFKIKDIDSANWTFRKLRAIEVKANEIKQLAQQEKARIEEWEKGELKVLEDNKEFFQGLLTEYYVIEKEKNPEFKLTTPYGKVSSRKQQPKWNYEEEKLIPYLENYDPKLIRVKKEVNKADFKEVVKNKKGFMLLKDGTIISNETGELIQGVTVEERPDTINVKVVE